MPLWQARAKAVLLLAALAALSHNIHLERSLKTKPEKMSVLQTNVHTLIFLLRTVPQIAVRRLLGVPSLTKNWWFHEELAMRVSHFHAGLGDVSVPNVFIGHLTNAQLAVARPAFGVHVIRVPPTELGFGPESSGRKKFGKSIECSALWVTLDENVSYAQSGVVKILYNHGGGFAIGQAGMYLAAHSKLLKDLRDRGITAGVLDIDYPLAPKVKHPIPTEACIHVYEYLVHEKAIIQPEDLVIGGDSAGGMIALNIGLRATRWGCAGVMLISPWIGHALNTESHEEFAEIDFIGGAHLIEQYQEAHVQGGKEKSVSDNMLDVFKKDLPFCALPPLWVSVGGFEVFKDDIIQFVKELEAHDAQVELYFANEVPHIYPMLWPLFIEKSGPALESAADFFVENLAKSRYQSQLMQETLTRDEVLKFKKVLSQTDLSGDWAKALITSDPAKIKSVMSSSNFADLVM